MRKKEYGSDFHYTDDQRYRTDVHTPNLFSTCSHLYYSGRAALYAILQNGIRKFGWKKIYMPSYYCHEVDDYIRTLDIDIAYYNANPFSEPAEQVFDDEASNVLLVVNYFGIRMPDHRSIRNMVIIKDLTHDLRQPHCIDADYTFGSLRKILPVPVGGFVHTREPGILPPPAWSVQAEEMALRRCTAMYLKKNYLEGGEADKPFFRSLFASGEQAFAEPRGDMGLPAVVREYLISLDIEKMIAAKQKNAAAIRAAIVPNDQFELISSGDFSEFACILKFNSTDCRNNLRNYLIENDIYPIVLWPGQLNEQDRTTADRILFVPIDFRYDSDDMQYLASTVNNFWHNG